MADPTSDPNDLFAQWRKQVQAGTDAWIKTVRQMASQGHVPPPPDPMQFWRQFSNLGPMNAPPFAGAGPVDPQLLAQWKRFLDDWIAAWSQALERAMGTEAFAEALGKTLDQFLTVQGKAREAVERSGKAAIDAVGLPSREQVVGLSRQLMDLEDRLEGLEDKIEGLGDNPRVTGLEGRVGALEGKIDSLRNSPRMAGMEDQIGALKSELGDLWNSPRMTGLEGRLGALEDKIEDLRNRPTAPPPEASGSPARRPADGKTGGGTARGAAARTGTAAAKTARTAATKTVAAAAAKAGRTAAKTGRGTANTAASATKTSRSTTKTGGGAAKTGGGTPRRPRKRQA